MESAYSQMLAELAAAMEEDEKAEWLENERNASDLQSRTPEPGTPIQQEQLQTSDQGDPAQQFPDQTPGHAFYYGDSIHPVNDTFLDNFSRLTYGQMSLTKVNDTWP